MGFQVILGAGTTVEVGDLLRIFVLRHSVLPSETSGAIAPARWKGAEASVRTLLHPATVS